MGSIFILHDNLWIKRGAGLTHFVFDLRLFVLRLFIRNGTQLRSLVRTKVPAVYVLKVLAGNGTDECVLAVRFECEQDSRLFRRFVEKCVAYSNQKSYSL